MDIDTIQELTSTDTPGAAVKAVRALVLGYPGDDPPGDDRKVTIWTGAHFAQAKYQHGSWYGGVAPGGVIYYRDVVRWWELPPVPGGEK